jgi:hypothetical protein
MVRVDLNRSIPCEFELEEVVRVVGERLCERLHGDGVLARLRDVGEIDVIRCPIRIKTQEEGRAAFENPVLRLHREDPREQPTVGNLP